ncbi:MAG: hypothetical protein QOG76_7352 [Pseudonocardiales bacterium]|nr:hypothetical protein [Pseudonocardiales bacterium]
MAPGQALTPAQALAGYTVAPALASGNARLGRIEVDAGADLTVFDDDPLAVRPDQLPSLPVALTVVDGQIRHRDPAVDS